MGQSTVILAVAATLLVGIVLLGMQRSNNESDANLATYHNDVLAREAAMTGINMTVRRLVDEPDEWFSNTNQYEYPQTDYNGAAFSTTVTSSHPDTVRVVSLGTHHNRTKRIEAVYAKGLIAGALNESFYYAVVSDEDLTLNGSVEIRAAASTSNADIHANGDLTSNGNRVHIEGFGTYGPSGSGTVNPTHAIDTVFDPNVDTNGADQNMHADDDVDIPNIDVSAYSTSPPADLVVSGDTTLFDMDRAWLNAHGYPAIVGTEESPFLMYVGGNLATSGTTVIEDIYFQVVVAGEITVGGNILSSTTPIPDKRDPQSVWDAWNAANLDAAGNTSIGLYADGDITVSGGFAIVGQLFSNNTVTLNGGGGQQMNILGGIVSANTDINVNGGLVIQFARVSTSGKIEELESDTPEGVRLVDWAEF